MIIGDSKSDTNTQEDVVKRYEEEVMAEEERGVQFQNSS